VSRGLGYTADGLITFLGTAHNHAAFVTQVASYGVLGAGVLGLMWLDVLPADDDRRRWAAPTVLGVIAVGAGAGAAAAIGNAGVVMIAFAFVATMIAGGDLEVAPSLVVAAAGVLAIEISGMIFNGDSVGVLFGLPVLVVAGLLVGRNRGAYRIQAEQSRTLLAQRDQLQAEQRRADLLDERARIAREIHDVLAHSLGALGIQIQVARATLTDHGDIARADEILAAAQRMAAEGLVETRRAVQALRADTRPLDQELALVSATHAQRYQVSATFHSDGEPRPLPPEATLALLRVTQEALVNAAKHAAGRPIDIELSYAETEVRLSVSNELPAAAGGGPDDTAPAGARAETPTLDTVNGGYGLTGMAERLRLLHGTLFAGRRGDRWEVLATLPNDAAGRSA
jgi:signal transduction histidine kinase